MTGSIRPRRGARRLALAGAILLAFTAGCSGSKPSAPDVSPEGLRVDRNEDGTLTVIFTGWKGRPEDYQLIRNHPGASKVLMANADVTDAELKLLSDLRGLRELDLSRTQVTCAGLAALRGLDKLEILWLEGNPRIDDRCWEVLGQMKSLRLLWLSGTGMSPEAAREWQMAAPGRRFQL